MPSIQFRVFLRFLQSYWMCALTCAYSPQAYITTKVEIQGTRDTPTHMTLSHSKPSYHQQALPVSTVNMDPLLKINKTPLILRDY